MGNAPCRGTSDRYFTLFLAAIQRPIFCDTCTLSICSLIQGQPTAITAIIPFQILYSITCAVTFLLVTSVHSTQPIS